MLVAFGPNTNPHERYSINMVEAKSEEEVIFDRQTRIVGWNQLLISSQVLINS